MAPGRPRSAGSWGLASCSLIGEQTRTFPGGASGRLELLLVAIVLHFFVGSDSFVSLFSSCLNLLSLSESGLLCD